MYLTIGLGIAVIITSILLYKELFFVTFDEEAAKLAGVPVGGINLVLMLLTAVTVSVASRIVGALMISSLLVIPVAAAMMRKAISRQYGGQSRLRNFSLLPDYSYRTILTSDREVRLCFWVWYS